MSQGLVAVVQLLGLGTRTARNRWCRGESARSPCCTSDDDLFSSLVGAALFDGQIQGSSLTHVPWFPWWLRGVLASRFHAEIRHRFVESRLERQSQGLDVWQLARIPRSFCGHGPSQICTSQDFQARVPGRRLMVTFLCSHTSGHAFVR